MRTTEEIVFSGSQTECEQALDDAIRYVFEKATTRTFQPMYPWVLVRLLPKSQNYKGSLVLPEQQNKTVHEGVVLVPWKPKYYIDKKGFERTRICEVQPGQHVVFPHWAGLPVPGLDETYYRIVREEGETTDGAIQAVIENIPEVDLAGFIDKTFDMESNYLAGDIAKVAKALQKRFVLIDREKPSVTLSGA